MAKYYSPLLLKSSGLFGQQNKQQSTDKKHGGILVNITAKVSSIAGTLIVSKQSQFKGCITLKIFIYADNQTGGWYSYRLSKTALNMATKNLSIELGRGKSKVICVALHPGII